MAKANQPFANNGVFTFEPNITGAVDEYNSVTIELRLFGDVIETNSRDGSTTNNEKVTIPAGTSIQTGSFFINSDIAGALGWTEASGGFNLKVKAGYFGPETTEVGQIKSIVESSDTADFGLASGGGSEFTVGYTDYINVLIGLKYGDADDDPTIDRFGWFVNPYGKAVLGPGTLEYSVYYGTATEIATGTLGVGLEYNNIALGDDLSLGIGGEFNYTLVESGDAPFNYGANLVLDVSNWLDVDLALGGNQEEIVNQVGVGLGVNNPSETLGLSIETEIGLAENAPIRINPDLWFKAGAATFTAGVDLRDINDPDGNSTFGNSVFDLIISLSF